MKVLINERLSKHKLKTKDGYLICSDAVLARTGKQTYRRSELYGDSAGDDEIDIDRRPEDVFAETTLASFENVPVTIEHPDVDVNSRNIHDYSVGFVRDVRKGKDNGEDVIIGDLVINDQRAIDLIESGEMTELSCGYDCNITDDDNPRQINIIGNHVALCRQGRAGNARIVDSVEDATMSNIEYDPASLAKVRKEVESYKGDVAGLKAHLEKVCKNHFCRFITMKEIEPNNKVEVCIGGCYGNTWFDLNKFGVWSDVTSDLSKYLLLTHFFAKKKAGDSAETDLEKQVIYNIDHFVKGMKVAEHSEFDKVREIAEKHGVGVSYYPERHYVQFIYKRHDSIEDADKIVDFKVFEKEIDNLYGFTAKSFQGSTVTFEVNDYLWDRGFTANVRCRADEENKAAITESSTEDLEKVCSKYGRHSKIKIDKKIFTVDFYDVVFANGYDRFKADVEVTYAPGTAVFGFVIGKYLKPNVDKEYKLRYDFKLKNAITFRFSKQYKGYVYVYQIVDDAAARLAKTTDEITKAFIESVCRSDNKFSYSGYSYDFQFKSYIMKEGIAQKSAKVIVNGVDVTNYRRIASSNGKLICDSVKDSRKVYYVYNDDDDYWGPFDSIAEARKQIRENKKFDKEMGNPFNEEYRIEAEVEDSVNDCVDDAIVVTPEIEKKLRNMAYAVNPRGYKFTILNDVCYGSEDGKTWYAGQIRTIEASEDGRRQKHKLCRVIIDGVDTTTDYARALYASKTGQLVDDTVEIDHLDGDHNNNVISNMELVTGLENKIRRSARVSARTSMQKNGYVSKSELKNSFGSAVTDILVKHNGFDKFKFVDAIASLNDVNPRKGESKNDFISRFMKETESEHPDKKQRLAVAYSYWRKNMKDSRSYTVVVQDLSFADKQKLMDELEDELYTDYGSSIELDDLVYERVKEAMWKKYKIDIGKITAKDSIKDKSDEKTINEYLNKIKSVVPYAKFIEAVSNTGVSVTFRNSNEFVKGMTALKNAGYDVENWDEQSGGNDFEAMIWAKGLTFDSCDDESCKDDMYEVGQAYYYAHTGDKVKIDGKLYEVDWREHKLGYSDIIDLIDLSTNKPMTISKADFIKKAQLVKDSVKDAALKLWSGNNDYDSQKADVQRLLKKYKNVHKVRYSAPKWPSNTGIIELSGDRTELEKFAKELGVQKPDIRDSVKDAFNIKPGAIFKDRNRYGGMSADDTWYIKVLKVEGDEVVYQAMHRKDDNYDEGEVKKIPLDHFKRVLESRYKQVNSIYDAKVDLNRLKFELEKAGKDWFKKQGYDYDDFFFAIKVKADSEGDVICNLSAELSYSGMERLIEVLDKVIQKYDKNAIFEQDDPGLASAWLTVSDSIKDKKTTTSKDSIVIKKATGETFKILKVPGDGYIYMTSLFDSKLYKANEEDFNEKYAENKLSDKLKKK